MIDKTFKHSRIRVFEVRGLGLGFRAIDNFRVRLFLKLGSGLGLGLRVNAY